MRKTCLIIGFILTLTTTMAQRTLEKVMEKLSGDEVPLVSITETRVNPAFIRLDARELEEFEVSHLPDAQFIGYENFDAEKFTSTYPDKKATYVVYCSVGIRSGKIGRKLLKRGYTDVRNLSGGIFKWVEEGNPVVDRDGKVTQKVHAYNRFWGMLLNKGEKVYGPEDQKENEGK